MYQADIILSVEWISQFRAENIVIRFFCIPSRRESFWKKADIILSIECILSFFEWISQFFIIHLNNENLFDWNKTEKERYDYVSGEYNSVYRMYSVFEWISQFAACLHNPSKRWESFRLKESKEEVSNECILSFSNGFHNSCRNYSHSILYIPSKRESFWKKADIILSIECILSFSNGFYNS